MDICKSYINRDMLYPSTTTTSTQQPLTIPTIAPTQLLASLEFTMAQSFNYQTIIIIIYFNVILKLYAYSLGKCDIQ